MLNGAFTNLRHNSPLELKINQIVRAREAAARKKAWDEAIEAELERQRQIAAEKEQQALAEQFPVYKRPDAPPPFLRRAHRILDAACELYQIRPEVMRGDTRKHKVVIARQVTMFVIYSESNGRESFPRIGRMFNKDHSTVVFAHGKIAKLLEAGDQQITRAVELLRAIE